MCTSPLLRFRQKYPIAGQSGNFSTQWRFKSLKAIQNEYKSFDDMMYNLDKYFVYNIIKCRKCDECKRELTNEWALRCYHELFTMKTAMFVTLTIDDTKISYFFDKKHLETYCSRCIKGDRYIKYPLNYTLCKGIAQDFLKRYRDLLYRKYGIKIRYFLVGEYGSSGDRPHYHAIIYGYKPQTFSFFDISKKGVNIYFSDELQSCWPFGLATFQDVNGKACFYTAKYCLKKLTYLTPEGYLENYFGRLPEFKLVSRGSCRATSCPFRDEIIKNCKHLNVLKNLSNPYCKYCNKKRGGLGFDWLSKNYKSMLKLGYCLCDGIKYKIPSYYLELIKLTNLELYDKYKIERVNHYDEVDKSDVMDIKRLNVRKTVNKQKILKFMNRL